MLTCNVTADVDDMRGKSVLVFLRPIRPVRDIRVHAWQVLDLSGNATASFCFDAAVSVGVATHGVAPSTSIESERVAISPGNLYQAVRPAGLSPQLQPCSAGMAADQLTPAQAGVYNGANPSIALDCIWFVSGQAVVTMPDVDWGMTCTFEYAPVLYFMIAAPLMKGENYTVQSLTGTTPYWVRRDTSVINVRVTRQRSRWVFHFLPDWQEG